MSQQEDVAIEAGCVEVGWCAGNVPCSFVFVDIQVGVVSWRGWKYFIYYLFALNQIIEFDLVAELSHYRSSRRRLCARCCNFEQEQFRFKC